MPTKSINISYTTDSAISFSAPVQQITLLDTTNRQYLRQVMLSQDGVKVIKGSYVVQIPMTQLFQAAYQAYPQLTWPPIILNQPTGSSVTAPQTASFNITASAEIAISYVWQYKGATSSSFVNVPNQAPFTGSTTASLFISTSSLALSGSQFRCVASNASGNTTSSAVYFYVG